MATIGMRDLYIARCIEDPMDGTTVYGAPKRLAKAMKAELSVETAEGVLYGDDAVDTIEKEFVKGTLKLGTTDLENTSEAELLGQSVDEDGVAFGGEEDDPPYWAIGFRAKKPGGLYKYLWIYKCKFKVPDETYETKGDGINFQTPEIEGEFIKRDSDARWKANYVCKPSDPVAQSWFDKVREPKGTVSPIPIEPTTPALLNVTSTEGTQDGKTLLSVTPALEPGNSYRYKIAAAVALPAAGEVLGADWTAWDGTAEITGQTGQIAGVAEVDSGSRCLKAGKATVTAKEGVGA